MDDPQRIERWLWLLDHGTPADRIDARWQLGRIFERRGQWDYAAECYEGNVRAGVRDLSLFARLGVVYLRDRRWRDAAEVGVYVLRTRLLGMVATVRARWKQGGSGRFALPLVGVLVGVLILSVAWRSIGAATGSGSAGAKS